MSESTTTNFTFGKILTNVRARQRKNQDEFLVFLEIGGNRSKLSFWERDIKKPYRHTMVLLIEKITPLLRPEELAALEELT
jgi:hypothetical protein